MKLTIRDSKRVYAEEGNEFRKVPEEGWGLTEWPSARAPSPGCLKK